MILSTSRLILREFTSADAEAMMGVFGDAEVMRFSSGTRDLVWVNEWIEKQNLRQTERGYSLWAVVTKDSQELLGFCGLTYFPDILGTPEIEVGYRLMQKHWGKGFATEAALAVRDYAREQLELKRLIAIIDPGNTASLNVAAKLGMSYEKQFSFPHYDHPDHIYAMAL
ncbi:MAG: GNAT family N-acetyltransferase [Armatimonadetes bacterium]|nr:GNAT family N-acetyltransferase [Armatimonadota bacterium]